MLNAGEPAPWFYAPTAANDRFRFDSVAGRRVVLTFFGSVRRPDSQAILTELERFRDRFDDVQALFFGVTIDPGDLACGDIEDRLPGIRFFHDFDQTISRLYGALPGSQPHLPINIESGISPPTGSRDVPSMAALKAGLAASQPLSVVLDERLRVLAVIRGETPALHVQCIMHALDSLPAIPEPTAAAVQAPVLVVPRVFEPAFCRRLIRLYEQQGGTESGFMRDQGGRTVGVIDYSHKRRMDCTIDDEELRRACMHRIHDRLVPEIFKAYQFHATRMERYIVACYESADGGHFRPHRDNTTRGTAHRRFAVSLHLNSEDYTGGELRFPEFGSQLYKAPTGGAVVFSCSLLHEAMPVLSGTRFVFLPFLYDDAAAQMRRQNEQFLATSLELPASSPLGSVRGE